MDDLLLLTPNKKSHRDKLEDFLKVLFQNGLKIHLRNASYLRRYNIQATLYFLKERKYLLNYEN